MELLITGEDKDFLRGSDYGNMELVSFPNNEITKETGGCIAGNYVIFIQHLFKRILRTQDNFRTYDVIDVPYLGASNQCYMWSVCYGNDKLIIFGYDLHASGIRTCIWTSTDFGASWTQSFINLANETSGNYYNTSHQMRFLNNRFIVCVYYYSISPAARIFTSTDGIEWAGHIVTNDYDFPYFVTYLNGVYLLGDFDDYLYYSTNLTSWTQVTSFFNAGESVGLVAAGNNVFVAAVLDYAVYVSSNGSSWTRYETGLGWRFYNVHFDDVRQEFVGIRHDMRIATSPDGINWTERSGTLISDVNVQNFVNLLVTDYTPIVDRWQNFTRTAEVTI